MDNLTGKEVKEIIGKVDFGKLKRNKFKTIYPTKSSKNNMSIHIMFTNEKIHYGLIMEDVFIINIKNGKYFVPVMGRFKIVDDKLYNVNDEGVLGDINCLYDEIAKAWNKLNSTKLVEQCA